MQLLCRFCPTGPTHRTFLDCTCGCSFGHYIDIVAMVAKRERLHLLWGQKICLSCWRAMILPYLERLDQWKIHVYLFQQWTPALVSWLWLDLTWLYCTLTILHVDLIVCDCAAIFDLRDFCDWLWGACILTWLIDTLWQEGAWACSCYFMWLQLWDYFLAWASSRKESWVFEVSG